MLRGKEKLYRAYNRPDEGGLNVIGLGMNGGITGVQWSYFTYRFRGKSLVVTPPSHFHLPSSFYFFHAHSKTTFDAVTAISLDYV